MSSFSSTSTPGNNTAILAKEFAAGGSSSAGRSGGGKTSGGSKTSKSGKTSNGSKASKANKAAKKAAAAAKKQLKKDGYRLQKPQKNQPLAVVPTLINGICPAPLRTYRLNQCACPATTPDLYAKVANHQTAYRCQNGASLGAAPQLALAGVLAWLLRAAFVALA